MAEREWFCGLWDRQNERPTIEPLIQYHYPKDLLHRAFVRYLNSDKRHIPSMEEIETIDPVWEADILLMDRIYRHKDPKLHDDPLGGA